MKKIERKVTVELVETQKTIDLSLIAEAIANVIKKEGLNNERREKVS